MGTHFFTQIDNLMDNQKIHNNKYLSKLLIVNICDKNNLYIIMADIHEGPIVGYDILTGLIRLYLSW